MSIKDTTHQERPRLGLIGLGLMGHGIGRNLLKGGYTLQVRGNVNRKPIDSLVGLGAVESASVATLTKTVDIIVICVTGSPQVEALIYGTDGILANGRPGQIVIDCSTSAPSSSEKINSDLSKVGITFVDAPLGRTPVEAEAGTLNTMVGATPEVLSRIRPVLQSFCENIIHVGSVLSAQKLKLINNFAIVGTVALITEALRTCDQVGISRAALNDLMSKGPLKSTLLQMTAEEILKNNFEGMKFSIRNAQKDVSYFNNMVSAKPDAPSLAAGLNHVLNTAVEQGLGEQFLPSLFKTQ